MDVQTFFCTLYTEFNPRVAGPHPVNTLSRYGGNLVKPKIDDPAV